MAVIRWLGFLFSLGLFQICKSQGFLDDILSDNSGCEESCHNTYPLHTYEKSLHLSFCQRGCRLFNIIDFVNEDENLNNTHQACSLSCQEAHMTAEDQSACAVGCSGQVPFAEKRKKEQLEVEEMQMQMLYPLLYVHSMYSNMVDKFSHHMSVSWSYYIQGDNGQLMVVRSGPGFVIDLNEGDDDEYKTSNYIESNIAAVDNSATPNLKNSQLHPLERSTSFDTTALATQKTDWLGCIAKKTGLPRLVLSFTIFVSVMIMFWLCLFTAVVPQENKIQPQKLSIYGDLEYLTELSDQKLLTKTHPQGDTVEAAPLPIKIKVERI